MPRGKTRQRGSMDRSLCSLLRKPCIRVLGHGIPCLVHYIFRQIQLTKKIHDRYNAGEDLAQLNAEVFGIHHHIASLSFTKVDSVHVWQWS